MKKRHTKKNEFTKRLVILNHLCAISWVYLTYILAFMGKEEIAEVLAGKVVTEVIAVTTVYAVKSLFENMSKNNTWPDKILGGKNSENNFKRDM